MNLANPLSPTPSEASPANPLDPSHSSLFLYLSLFPWKPLEHPRLLLLPVSPTFFLRFASTPMLPQPDLPRSIIFSDSPVPRRLSSSFSPLDSSAFPDYVLRFLRFACYAFFLSICVRPFLLFFSLVFYQFCVLSFLRSFLLLVQCLFRVSTSLPLLVISHFYVSLPIHAFFFSPRLSFIFLMSYSIPTFP